MMVVECCCSRFRESVVMTFSRGNAGFRNDTSDPLVMTINEVECDHCPFCGERIISRWLGAVEEPIEESEGGDE